MSDEKHYRDAFAASLRNMDAEPPEGIGAAGLAVYRRLLRNNVYNFLDRCYVRTATMLDSAAWQEAKAHFITHGQATSPYFSDIPAQFLAHLRHHALLDARLLAVMDVECRELAAEIATDDPATPILIDIDDEAFDDVRLALSASASLAAYDWQVHENTVPAGRTYSLVWRDPAEQVQCAAISSADFSLLQQLHDAPDSVNTLIAALRDCLANAEAQRLPLRHALRHWLALGVLYPV